MTPIHHCQVVATPWRGVYGTHIQSARHFGRHSHYTHGVGLIDDGAQRSASGRGPVVAARGDVITTNPGEVHDGRPASGETRRWRMLYFAPHVLAELAGVDRSIELTRPVLHDTRVQRSLSSLFARLGDWDRCRSDDATLACEEALTSFAGQLLERHGTAAVTRDADADMRRICDRLGDAGSHTPSLAELADIAGVSRYQLLRRFARVHGVPPHAWLLQRRAEIARAAISGSASLADAASDAGFADQSHMTRVFVRLYGFTPGAFRAATKRG